MTKRRLSIAAQLVDLGLITADRATPENPAVEVRGELLPPDAELGLCLTCHGFSSGAPYPFAETAGVSPNRGSFRMNPPLADFPSANAFALILPSGDDTSKVSPRQWCDVVPKPSSGSWRTAVQLPAAEQLRDGERQPPARLPT